MDTTLLTGIIGAIVTIAAAIVAYYLGKRQGREQYRHEKGSTAVMETRSRAFDISSDLEVLHNALETGVTKTNVNRAERSRQLTEKVSALTTYYRNEEPWIRAETRDKIEPLMTLLTQIATPMLYDEGIDDATSSLQYVSALDHYGKNKERLGRMLDDLTEESRRIAGTDS